MRLASDRFTLKLDSRTFVLRPSLRAAFNLNQKHDGFQALSHAIAGGSFSACDDLISASCTDPNAWALHSMKPSAVREVLAARDQLLEFVLVLTGTGDKTSDKPQTGKPISFEEYHTQLFQIGTGWLGWSPADTWAATPAEIINAHTGRIAMLKAIFGSGKGDDQPADVADGSLANIKADLNAIGNLQNHVMGSR